MKFDDKYPNALIDDGYIFEGAEVYKVITNGPCAFCKDDTHWVDLSLECWMCSEECDRQMWKEYFDALNS